MLTVLGFIASLVVVAVMLYLNLFSAQVLATTPDLELPMWVVLWLAFCTTVTIFVTIRYAVTFLPGVQS